MEPDKQTDDSATVRLRRRAARIPKRLLERDRTRFVVSKKRLRILLVALVCIGLIATVSSLLFNGGKVPQKIKAAVDFSVYYPTDLPTGYRLRSDSFRMAESGVVLFALTHDKEKDIVFSEVKTPAQGDIDKFISNYIPLNTVQQVPLGEAKIGAYGSAPNIRTAVSLPIKSGPWLIMTAPPAISHSDLIRIIQSLTK